MNFSPSSRSSGVGAYDSTGNSRNRRLANASAPVARAARSTSLNDLLVSVCNTSPLNTSSCVMKRCEGCGRRLMMLLRTRAVKFVVGCRRASPLDQSAYVCRSRLPRGRRLRRHWQGLPHMSQSRPSASGNVPRRVPATQRVCRVRFGERTRPENSNFSGRPLEARAAAARRRAQ